MCSLENQDCRSNNLIDFPNRSHYEQGLPFQSRCSYVHEPNPPARGSCHKNSGSLEIEPELLAHMTCRGNATQELNLPFNVDS